MGHLPSPKPSLSLVKALVNHPPPVGALSKNPFLSSVAPSGQAGPASTGTADW